jgi:2-keto-4-pentenoate hydratase/2-oxohepta-3-ene-1,7-dioic acid hydratase in catechol pathway
MLRTRDATVEAATRIADALLPGDMVAFLGGGERALEGAREALAWATDTGTLATPGGTIFCHAPGDVKLLAPVPRPPLLRDFMAFETHLTNIYPRLGRAIPGEWYELPVYYKGNPGSVAGDNEAIAIPPYADALDFEFELAFVIGKGGLDIPPERALEHIVGFTIYNDFSERVIQAREMAVGLGPAKGKDFVNGHVLGPALVTMDEIPDVYAMAMSARVNDEIWCEASSASIHWRFEQMIAHASRGERLVPGEVFGSGTVGGGAGAETGRSLTRGDRIALTVGPLGTLRNTIV